MYSLPKHIESSALPGQKRNAKSFFQPKLSINQPNDIHEQEADAVADRVMGMPISGLAASSFFSPESPVIKEVQRKCSHCEEEENLRRKENNSSEIQATGELEIYVSSLSNTGNLLPPDAKDFFESRMGYDFSGVKIHTGDVAAKSADSIHALAYTTANNIVFNKGQYSPGTANGDKLLAHELTHVVQQSENISKKIQRQPAEGKDNNSAKTTEAENSVSGIADPEDWQEENFVGDYLLITDPRHDRAINYLLRAKLRILSALINGLKWGFETISNDRVMIMESGQKKEYSLQQRNAMLETLVISIDKTKSIIRGKNIPLENRQWGMDQWSSTVAFAAIGPFLTYLEKKGDTQKYGELLLDYIISPTQQRMAIKQAPAHMNYTNTGLYVRVPAILNNRTHLTIISGFETANKGDIVGELLSDRFGRFLFHHDQRIYVDKNNDVVLPY